MKSNPFSRPPPITISYQNQTECIPVGCCFSNYNTLPYQPPKTIQARHRVYSQPKEPRQKKIDLVIAKRGMSHSKDTKDSTRRIASADKCREQVKSNIKEHEHRKIGITLGSKLNSQKTSLKTSKVSFNKDMKIDHQGREIKQSYMTTRNTTKPLYTQGIPGQGNASHTSVALISEISLVEEEFISHGSETLQALNFIKQIKSMEHQEMEKITKSQRQKTEKKERIEYNRQLANPFSKKTEKAGFVGRHKKLFL